MSRIYGGIHTMTDNLAGQYLGSEIGTQAAADFFTAVPEPAPSTLFSIGAAGLALVYSRWLGPCIQASKNGFSRSRGVNLVMIVAAIWRPRAGANEFCLRQFSVNGIRQHPRRMSVSLCVKTKIT
jgi:hypothetical protein